MVKRISAALILVITISMSVISVFAQPSPQQTLTPAAIEDADPFPTEDPAHPNRNMALYQYRIAYLIAEDALAPEHVVAPDRVSEDLGAVVFNAWDDFLQTHEEVPFQAVIIHQSALPIVEYKWVSAAYRTGIVISVIDIYYPELSELMGFNCGTHPDPDDWYEKDYYITFHFNAVTTNPADRAKIIYAMDHCLKMDEVGITSKVQIARGRSQESLEGEYGYRFFNGSLQSALKSVTSWDKLNQAVDAR